MLKWQRQLLELDSDDEADIEDDEEDDHVHQFVATFNWLKNISYKTIMGKKLYFLLMTQTMI